MAAPERVAFIRNIAEVPWRDFPIILVGRCRSLW